MGIKRNLAPAEDGTPRTWSKETADQLNEPEGLDEFNDSDCPPDVQDKKPRAKPRETTKAKPAPPK